MTIQLIVGLGNPGPGYVGSRHNAGFDWLEGAARQLGATLQFDRNWQGAVARVDRPRLGPLWLLAPQTFMNLSGRSVGPLARFYKIPVADILVVHDELDLAPGEVKIKQGGGSAGHNGLKDISAALGDPGYWRLRLGIGHPGQRHEVADFVLRKPPLDERIALEQAIDKSLGMLGDLSGDITKAVAALHAKPQRPSSGRQRPAESGVTPTAAAAPLNPPEGAPPQG